jgi:hypothetical protein
MGMAAGVAGESFRIGAPERLDFRRIILPVLNAQPNFQLL